MPRKRNTRRLITPLLLFTLAGWALWALGRNAPESTAHSGEAASGDSPRTPDAAPSRAPAHATWSKRRLATSLAFVTLFFGGAAFSAGAGDVVAEALEGDTVTDVTTTEETTTEEAPPEEPPAPEETPPTEEEPPAPEETPTEPDTPTDPDEQPPAEDEPTEPTEPTEPDDPGESDPAPDDDGSGGEAPAPPPASPGVDEDGKASPGSTDSPVLDKNTRSSNELDPEADADGFFATIWLHRTLPDPTPPAKRLDPAFARTIAAEAKRADISWALLLGTLRAKGFDGRSMNVAPVRGTARRLAELGAKRNSWRALLAYGGRPDFADQAIALTRYNRAVGLKALVTGLTAAKPRLQKAVLADKRIAIYSGGRLDIAMGRTDIRVLVLVRYLAIAHGQATVSSLTSGHRIFSRPGVVSAHTYGLAVDIAALGDRSIYGNQEPGGLTERAVRNVLLLPSELQPKQVISLLGLGGASFPLADHADHIHVGY